MPESNWKRIELAPRGIGPVLLRAGTSNLDPSYVGFQADNGRWYCGDAEVHPIAWCLIPEFDLEDGAEA